MYGNSLDEIFEAMIHLNDDGKSYASFDAITTVLLKGLRKKTIKILGHEKCQLFSEATEPIKVSMFARSVQTAVSILVLYTLTLPSRFVLLSPRGLFFYLLRITFPLSHSSILKTLWT